MLIISSIPHQQPDLVSELFNSNRCIRGHFLSLLFIYDLDKLLQDGARWIRSFDSNNSFSKLPHRTSFTSREKFMAASFCYLLPPESLEEPAFANKMERKRLVLIGGTG